jgi:hypothetical protein
MELNSSDEEDKRGPSSASASACKPIGHDQPHRLGLRSTFARRWAINSIILVCVLELYRGSLRDQIASKLTRAISIYTFSLFRACIQVSIL